MDVDKAPGRHNNLENFGEQFCSELGTFLLLAQGGDTIASSIGNILENHKNLCIVQSSVYPLVRME